MRGSYNLLRNLGATLDDAIDVFCAHRGNIQLVDSAGNLRIVAQRGFGREFLEYFAEVRAGSAGCGRALQAADRVAIREVARSPIFAGTPALQVMLNAGALACVSTPLMGPDGKILGMLNVHWNRPFEAGIKEYRELDPVILGANHALDNATNGRPRRMPLLGLASGWN